MKCKCGKDAESQQMTIDLDDNTVWNPICHECFNELGNHDPKPDYYENGLFYASQMGGE